MITNQPVRHSAPAQPGKGRTEVGGGRAPWTDAQVAKGGCIPSHRLGYGDPCRLRRAQRYGMGPFPRPEGDRQSAIDIDTAHLVTKVPASANLPGPPAGRKLARRRMQPPSIRRIFLRRSRPEITTYKTVITGQSVFRCINLAAAFLARLALTAILCGNELPVRKPSCRVPSPWRCFGCRRRRCLSRRPAAGPCRRQAAQCLLRHRPRALRRGECSLRCQAEGCRSGRHHRPVTWRLLQAGPRHSGRSRC